ncbi:MAG: phenylalanine--tRNA ligase subunit beta [Bacteroidetes bacterium]|nr:phenylalanine--tRNA ligase subunit beta [Bacteroidota bacterium]
MKISHNWLKQFIKTTESPDRIAEILTDLGLEVEGVESFSSVRGGLKGILVGQVLTCDKHPDADRLKVTTVDIGLEKPLHIVCGAPNVAVGQKVPVATVGTQLFDKENKPWVIKQGKIRGQVSEGMICAEDEIGLGNSHDGILILDEKLAPGALLSKVYQVEEDTVYEIGLTPNRADAMSHLGVARDLRAGIAQREKLLELITPSVSSFNVDNRALKIDVEVADKLLAPRYCGVSLTDVSVKESPNWLKNRLKAIGLTPKNNVVDATNYVLHELGQPLHAFDADKIKSKKIVVKTLPENTEFVTLDGVVRKLHAEDLMICDENKPLCIAGVFGGLDSGVTEQTTRIFLESAYFDPVSVRKTSKRHNLNTDASFRFERGIDINLVDYALKRAAILISELSGAKISSDIVDFYPKKVEDFKVFLTYEKVNKLIGENLPEDTIKKILSYLDIKVINVTESGMGLSIPPYRVDVTREADVIEEILRIYGYNNIQFSEKLNASVATVGKFEDYKIQDLIAQQLVAQGFFEIMTNSLSSPEYHKLDPAFEDHSAVNILNPLSQDLSVMRQDLLFTGLESVAHNLNRRRNDLKLFEFGKKYQRKNGAYIENKCLGLFVTGAISPENWSQKRQESHFFYLKGVVHACLEKLGIHKPESRPCHSSLFSDSLVLASQNGEDLATIGEVHAKVCKHFGIKQTVYYASFNWDTIMAWVGKNQLVFSEPPKYPEVRRDLALLLDKSVSYQALYETAKKQEKKLLKSVDLFDVYEGKNLPEGKKSYALSFILQDENKTLEDKQIDKIMKKIQTLFETEFGAVLR